MLFEVLALLWDGVATRENFLEKELLVQQVSTEDQIADMLTKPLFKPRLLTLCTKIGLLWLFLWTLKS